MDFWGGVPDSAHSVVVQTQIRIPRRAKFSGQFVWPTSTLTVSSLLGMRVLSRLSTTVSITPSHFIRVLIPGQHFILTGWTAHRRGLCFAISGALDWPIVFFWLSLSCAAVVVFFHFVSPRHAGSLVLSPLASQSSPVSSRSLLQSSMITSQSLLVPSSSLWQPSLSLDTGSSHRQYVHMSRFASRGAASWRFSSGPLKTPLVRMRPRGYVPHGYAGADGGSGPLVRATAWCAPG